MGEVERVRATYGTSFGSYGGRVNGALDRQPKKHQDQQEHRSQDDALELHEEGQEEATTTPFHVIESQDDHLDLSA